MTDFVTKFDAEPEFWQFLSGLRHEDIITELVQNELDAEASYTRIIFGREDFICEGNGMSIDDEGWTRLSFVRGAGHQAPRKRFRIGVKNHGLKACFILGNDINLFSAGMHFRQTLYSDGQTLPPRPGTFPLPVKDPSAPLQGCRIQVPYRTKLLATPVGEPLEFAAPSTKAIETIFERACQEIAGRFIGVTRPGIRDTYTLELSHYKRGNVTFAFRCTPGKNSRRGWLFSRNCTVSGNISNRPPDLRESALVFATRLPAGSTHEIPQFYKSPNGGFYAELAWPTNTKGASVRGHGQLRYPITYTGQGESSSTGLGIHYSGPFVSDQERHGATATEFNENVMEVCDAAVIRLLRDHLLQKHGPKSLQVLVDSSSAPPDRLRGMTERLLAERVVPLARRYRSKLQLGPLLGPDGATLKPVVIPSYSWSPGEIVRILCRLCPDELDQIDPAVPGEIVELLGGRELVGWKTTHVTFDEDDVLERMQTGADPYFDWSDEQTSRRCLANVDFSRCCLDVLLASSEKSKMSAEEISVIYLPDSDGIARPLNEMYVGNELPPQLATLRKPRLLNPKIATHRFMKRQAWKPRTYSLSTFLETAELASQPEETRRVFFGWLKKNFSLIPSPFRTKLANWPIWPDRNGSLRNLATLCQPRSSKVAEILSGTVCLPSKDVIHLLAGEARRTLSVRSLPSEVELDGFYTKELLPFPRDRPLSSEEVVQFRKVEERLETLATHSDFAAWLAKRQGFGLAGDGVLRPISVLHGNAHAINSAALSSRYLLDRKAHHLDRVFRPRTQPSVEAVVHSLRADPDATGFLIPRLRALSVALKNEGIDGKPIENVPCIPYDGRLVEPAVLAFRGSRGDYWGNWKCRLSGKGLSADEQALYRQAGVISGDPDPETSMAFFHWLNEQPDPTTVSFHLEAVVRHIASERSVRTWWESHPDLPCIPVESGQSISLVSLNSARQKGSHVLLPDFEQLAAEIRADEDSRKILFAITSHQNVTEPIAEHLRAIGVQSLLSVAATPTSVRGESPSRPPSQLTSNFSELQSSRMSNLPKRLSALQFPAEHLRGDWHSRFGQIKGLMTAKRVLSDFRVGRRTYRIESASGFDENTGIIWLGQSADQDALFDSLAHRIFRQGAPRFAAAVLQKAVRWELKEGDHIHNTNNVESIPDETSDPSSSEHELAETQLTHRPTLPDPGRNVPSPGPIPIKAPQGGRVPSRSLSGKSNNGKSGKDPIELELVQIEDLKRNQYAWHCQICLSDKRPGELAPEGSYVALAENRRLLIEAEHADQKHAGGARNAGNLIILCHFHHRQLGDALSRSLITEALRNVTETKRIPFSSGSRDERVLEGEVISVTPKSLGTTFRFFFTKAHKEYWLKEALALRLTGQTQGVGQEPALKTK